MVLFSCNLLNVNPLKCVSINKEECKIRPEIIVFICNEPSFYLNNVKIVTVVGNYNNINDPYKKLCVPDVVKNKCQSIQSNAEN